MSSKKYVMIDYDETISLNPIMFKQIFNLLQRCHFKPTICTARSKDACDNSDIAVHFNLDDVIFCDGRQKEDVLRELHILKKVAFWIDDNPNAIVSECRSEC